MRSLATTITGLPNDPYTAPSGSWMMPKHVQATGAMALGSGPISGNVYFLPFDIGPQPASISSMGINVTTVQVAGAVTTSLGLYPDNGSGGLPNVTAPVFTNTSTVLTGSVGRRTITVAATLAPGRYWSAVLLVQTSAPTTLPALTCITGCTSLWLNDVNTFGTVARAVRLDSQTALPTVQPAATTWRVDTGSGCALALLKVA